ncbi:MAG: HNH endonuclease [Pyrinomonadaceae bacterium MAG19_C2-C3]|nr:HNH endonuclease [Pyrinomonadaceae bacterium MAG19_C2-C3]
MFSVEEYIYGLRAIRKRINPKQYGMLEVQYSAPNRTVTVPQLADAVGYSNFNAVNLHYGKLGRLLYEALEEFSDLQGEVVAGWWNFLSSGRYGSNGFLWTMHPALAIALEEMGIVKNVEHRLSEEINTAEVFLEGSVRRVTVNAYERNPEARSRSIAHYGTQCCVCDFDYGSTYGELLDGYIHVHHLKPLSEIGEEYEIDPISDLRPVCANCHAVIHRRNPPFTIDEVKAMLK